MVLPAGGRRSAPTADGRRAPRLLPSPRHGIALRALARASGLVALTGAICFAICDFGLHDVGAAHGTVIVNPAYHPTYLDLLTRSVCFWKARRRRAFVRASAELMAMRMFVNICRSSLGARQIWPVAGWLAYGR